MPNLFQQVYSAITGGLWQRFGGQGFTRYRLLMPGSRFDYEREAGDLWSNPVVGLCLDWLGNRFPRPRLHVSRINQRTGDYTPLGRHPLTDLWERPNPHYTRRTMEKAVGLSLKTDGNAYVYKVRDRAGRVVQLWWLPHYRVMPTWPADGSAYIDGYKVRLDSVVYELPPEDVIHIRDGIDPRNDRLGLCALRSNIREVCTINEESGYRAAILRNSGVPGLVVIPDNEMLKPNQADADSIRERFKELAGGDARGSTVVLGGKYKVEVLGFSPEQLNLIDFPVIPTARILASMGVAPMSVGLPDPGKTYANLSEANRSSWGTIISTQELVAEALRWNLLPEFGADPYSYTCEYDYTHIQEMQESLDAVWTRTVDKGWKGGVIQLNEAREILGLEPDPDGDRYYPGTGSPEEIERQQEQQAQRNEAMAQRPVVQPGKEEDGEKHWWLEEKFNANHDAGGRFAATGGAHGPHLQMAAAAHAVSEARKSGLDVKLSSGPPSGGREKKLFDKARAEGKTAVVMHAEPKLTVTQRGQRTTVSFDDDHRANTFPDGEKPGRWVSEHRGPGDSIVSRQSFATQAAAQSASEKYAKTGFPGADQYTRSVSKITGDVGKTVQGMIDDHRSWGGAIPEHFTVRIKVLGGGSKSWEEMIVPKLNGALVE